MPMRLSRYFLCSRPSSSFPMHNASGAVPVHCPRDNPRRARVDGGRQRKAPGPQTGHGTRHAKHAFFFCSRPPPAVPAIDYLTRSPRSWGARVRCFWSGTTPSPEKTSCSRFTPGPCCSRMSGRTLRWSRPRAGVPSRRALRRGDAGVGRLQENMNTKRFIFPWDSVFRSLLPRAAGFAFAGRLRSACRRVARRRSLRFNAARPSHASSHRVYFHLFFAGGEGEKSTSSWPAADS